jgi:hypothetical protein
LQYAEICGLINRVNKRNNIARLNDAVIFEMLAGYISQFWLMNYVMLLAYAQATFKPER